MKVVMLIIVVVASLCAGCDQSGETLRQRYLETARVSVRQGAYERALEALNQMPVTLTPSKEFYLIQGLSHFKMREFHHAMDAFEKAAPSSPALKHYMGYLHLFLGEVAPAVSLLEEMRDDAGSTPKLAILNGNIKLRQRAFAASRTTFAGSVQDVNQLAQAYVGLGHVALFEKDVATAEQHYLSAVLVAPDDLQVYHVLSKFYILMGRYREAEANLRIALNKFSDHVNTIVLLGNLMILQERCTDALSLFRQYKHLTTSSVLNLQILRCMMKEKEYEQAAEMIDSFRSKNSRKTLLVSGEFNLRQGKVDHALSDLYRIAATQDDFIVDYYLGVVY